MSKISKILEDVNNTINEDKDLVKRIEKFISNFDTYQNLVTIKRQPLIQELVDLRNVISVDKVKKELDFISDQINKVGKEEGTLKVFLQEFQDASRKFEKQLSES